MAYLNEIPKDKKLVDINTAASTAGVARRTIYNWINKDKIDYIRTCTGSVRIVEDSLWRVNNE